MAFAHLLAKILAHLVLAPYCCELKSLLNFFSIIPFSPSLSAHQPFAKSMPVISARGINAPVTYQRNFVSFYEGRGARKGWDNNQMTALVSWWQKNYDIKKIIPEPHMYNRIKNHIIGQGLIKAEVAFTPLP
jgi:hypothetical protein